MSLEPAQRAGLERARAIGVAREHFAVDIESATVDTAPFGVVVRVEDRAVVVASSDDLAVLGGVLVWLDRQDLRAVNLVVEHHGAVHARRAAVLAPELSVWELVRGDVCRVDHAGGVPDRTAVPGIDLSIGDVPGLVAMIERCGASVVVEDGIVRAEVAGLEVGRVVVGADGPQFEVGVGRFDREAGVLLHAGQSLESALCSVVEQVAAHRFVGAPSHAINRLCRERWLRDVVANDPGAYGLRSPQFVDPVPPRVSLLEAGPASLIDELDGKRVLVGCTVGADLGVVPSLADLTIRHAPDEVWLVLPERDIFAHVERLLARLGTPSSCMAIEVPWAG